MNSSQRTAQPESGWVLFDGICGFCSWWVPFWAPLLRAHGYDIEQLQAGWIRERLQLSDEELLNDILILKPDGGRIVGADVYRDVMRKVWWLLPLYLFSVMPLGRQTFDLAYRLFKNNRYRISKACRMPPAR